VTVGNLAASQAVIPPVNSIKLVMPYWFRMLTAIEDHASQGSEANAVISIFNGLSESQKQDLLNFLRSL